MEVNSKDAEKLCDGAIQLLGIFLPACGPDGIRKMSANLAMLQARILDHAFVMPASETPPKRRGRPPKAQAEAPKAQSGNDDDIAMALAKIEMNDAAWLVKQLGETSQRPRSTLKKLINAGKTTMDALTELLESR